MPHYSNESILLGNPAIVQILQRICHKQAWVEPNQKPWYACTNINQIIMLRLKKSSFEKQSGSYLASFRRCAHLHPHSKGPYRSSWMIVPFWPPLPGSRIAFRVESNDSYSSPESLSVSGEIAIGPRGNARSLHSMWPSSSVHDLKHEPLIVYSRTRTRRTLGSVGSRTMSVCKAVASVIQMVLGSCQSA